jgi:hypothetical protein
MAPHQNPSLPVSRVPDGLIFSRHVRFALFAFCSLMHAAMAPAAQPDFNGDNQADLVWRNYKTGENSIWLMNGTTPMQFLLIRRVEDLNWQIGGSGDFNGDGKPDILWRNYATGENSIWLMNGTTPTQFLVIRRVEDLNWQIGGTGDFNADGKPDILWRNYSTGENSIWLMNGIAPASFRLTQKVADLNWRMAGSGDFNGDGRSDILWRNYSTGENSIWLMNGTTPTRFLSILNVGDLSWQMAGSADFNADGKADILWRKATTGENSIWKMNGTEPAQFVLTRQVQDLNWQMAGVADTDQDSIPDGLERGMLDKFRPYYRFSLDGGPDPYHPTDADWFVRNSALLNSPAVGTGSDQLVPRSVLALHPERALGVFTQSWGYSDRRKQRNGNTTPYRLDIAQYGLKGEADWNKIKSRAVGLYGHVSRLSEGRVKIEYWQFFAYNDAPTDDFRHEGDWETVQLHVEADGSAIRTIIHEVHGKRIVFNLAGARVADLGGGFREYTGSGPNRPHRASFSLWVEGPAGIGWAQENLVRVFCVQARCTHPVVHIEHSGHAFWPAEYWSWPGARRHGGDGESYLVAAPPNLGEINAANRAVPGADIIVHFNGDWGAKNDGPEGPGMKGTWGNP